MKHLSKIAVALSVLALVTSSVIGSYVFSLGGDNALAAEPNLKLYKGSNNMVEEAMFMSPTADDKMLVNALSVEGDPDFDLLREWKFPNAVVVFPKKDIGKEIIARVIRDFGNGTVTLAESDKIIIQTEMLSMELKSVKPITGFPMLKDSFFDIFYELEIDGKKKDIKVVALNGWIYENLPKFFDDIGKKFKKVDDAITALAADIGKLKTDVTALVANDVIQDTKLSALGANDLVQDGRLTLLEAK